MFFKKSKKKQLQEIRRKIFFMRVGLEVQKEHALHLAEAHPEQYINLIENVYVYMIKKLKELEEEF